MAQLDFNIYKTVQSQVYQLMVQFVGGGVTSINFAGPGVTTAFVTPSTGIATVFFQGGGGGVGAAGTWASDSVGVATSKVVGVGTAQAVGTANSEGALQSLGNIAITDGALLIDNDISSSINVPAGKKWIINWYSQCCSRSNN